MPETNETPLARLRRVLDRLLDPDTGCPWDRKQTTATLRLYLMEETYELLDALEQDDPSGVREEMGDCLFILLFLARLYEGRGLFDIDDAMKDAADKMISRHPHVFGEGQTLESAEQVRTQWHQIKQKERKKPLLEAVPKNMPALMRAHRLTERVGRVGFDWAGPEAVLESLAGELEELREAMAGGDRERIAAELGDVLFTAANAGRHLKVNAEDALRSANQRFTDRFEYVESRLGEKGRSLGEASLEEMDALWEEAKGREG